MIIYHYKDKYIEGMKTTPVVILKETEDEIEYLPYTVYPCTAYGTLKAEKKVFKEWYPTFSIKQREMPRLLNS